MKKNVPAMLTGLTLFGLAVSVALTSCASAPKAKLKLGETADGEVVEAEGLAAVTSDLVGVKRAALNDAKKDAVEKVIGVLISAKTVVEKAITIQQSILSKTDGYVKDYEIVKEGKEDDGIYHSKIRALVSYKQVENALKDLDILQSPTVGNPRVAILLDEKVEGSEDQVSACSDSLTQGLLERGYKVVDRSELAAIRVAEATQDLLAGNTAKALKPIVQKLNAEVVITGKASASNLNAQGLGGLISYRGTLTAKALKAQTGEILATVSTQGSGLDATKEAAAQKALTLLGKNGANELGGKIATELARRSSVLVTVRGLKGINQLGAVKESISKTAGVADIYMRSYSEGIAELEVKIQNATSADISASITKNTELNAQVTAQTQDSLELQIQ